MKKILYVLTLLLGAFFLTGNVNAQIQETGIQEAMNDAIDYFGNKDNFEDEQTYNAYQKFPKYLYH